MAERFQVGWPTGFMGAGGVAYGGIGLALLEAADGVAW